MRRLIPACSLAVIASPAAAADLRLALDLPRLSVAEYHRPYVAIWIEKPDLTSAGTLAVWYEKGRPENGQRYLKELRQWWRKAGREMTTLPDALSGATRAPGVQSIVFKGASGPLAALPPGPYTLVVEVAREVGGRETLRLPFTWPAQRAQAVKAQGKEEVGAVSLTVR